MPLRLEDAEAIGSEQQEQEKANIIRAKATAAFDVCLNQIPEEWHQVAVRFRRTNGIRDKHSE